MVVLHNLDEPVEPFEVDGRVPTLDRAVDVARLLAIDDENVFVVGRGPRRNAPGPVCRKVDPEAVRALLSAEHYEVYRSPALVVL